VEGNIQLTDIRRRVQRLQRLAMGLAKEHSILDKGEDPLLYRGEEAVPRRHPACPLTERTFDG
jgi:hypothetical protein